MANLNSKPTLTQRIRQFLFHDLWHADTNLLPKYKAVAYTLMKIGSVSYDEWVKGRLVYRASALTYFTLLSIVPILALCFGISKGFGLEASLNAWLQQHLDWAGDALPTIMNFTNSLLANTKGGLIAGVGFLFLLYSVVNMFSHIELALNDIRHIELPRTWVRCFTDYLAMMILTPIFLIVSSSVTFYLFTTIDSVTAQTEISGLVRFFFSLVPLLMSWILFACMYIIMPNAKVKLTPTIIASIIAGTGFQLLQFVYIQFQVGVTRYNAIYGSFAALPLLLIFLYYTWIIFLLGANIAYAIEHIKRIEIERSTVSLSMRKQKIAYLFIIYTIVKGFETRQEPSTISALAKTVKLPEHIIQTMLRELTEVQILSEVMLSPSSTGYQPAFDIQQMTMGVLMETIEKDIHNESDLLETDISARLTDIFDEHDRSFAQAKVLVKDI